MLLEDAFKAFAYYREKVRELLEEDRQYWTERAQAGSASAGAIRAQNYRQNILNGYMDAVEDFCHALGHSRSIFSPIQNGSHPIRQGRGAASPPPRESTWMAQERHDFERRLEAARKLCREQGRDASHLHCAKPHDTRTYNL